MYKQLKLAPGQRRGRLHRPAAGILTLLLLCSLAVAGVGKAQDVYTDTASFDVTGQLPVVGPPIPVTSLISFSDTGRSYTNALGTNANGTEVRTVGATLLATVKHAGGAETSAPVGSGGTPLVAVFGLQGAFSSATDIHFGAGLMQIFELPAGTNFVASDATTWGTNGTLLASYGLVAPANVDDGNTLAPPMGMPEPISLLASDVNVSGVNTAVGSTSQTTLLMVEQLPGLLSSDSGLAGMLVSPAEGGLASLDQELIDTSNVLLSMGSEQVLNQIALDSFGAAFASFGGGGPLDFDPETNGGNVTDTNNTGFDVVVNLGGSLVPTLHTAIPEPSTIALLTFLLATVAGRGAYRRSSLRG